MRKRRLEEIREDSKYAYKLSLGGLACLLVSYRR